MNSSLIGKIEKAKRYAQEPERISVNELNVTFRGDNDTHSVSLHEQHWHCTCDFFAEHRLCVHTMALEKMLLKFIPAEAQSGIAV